MKILALESSAIAASCAIWEDGKMLAQYFQNCALTHSRTLMPMVSAMLENCEIKLENIDKIAVARGPGSFTGIRIGVATAKGLAWGANKPLCGISTLEAMVYPVITLVGENEIICCAMDARRDEIYNALFENNAALPVRLCEDRAVSMDVVVEEAKKSGKTYLFVGDGAKLCYNKFLENGLPARLSPPHMVFQNAWGVAMASVNAEGGNADELSPVYLRLSQAERERISRKKDN